MKYINVVCDGETNTIIRCCQGAAIRLCSFDQFKKFNNHEILMKKFQNNKLTSQVHILEILISMSQIVSNYPILDMMDFFVFHRRHSFYLEIVDET